MKFIDGDDDDNNKNVLRYYCYHCDGYRIYKCMQFANRYFKSDSLQQKQSTLETVMQGYTLRLVMRSQQFYPRGKLIITPGGMTSLFMASIHEAQIGNPTMNIINL